MTPFFQPVAQDRSEESARPIPPKRFRRWQVIAILMGLVVVCHVPLLRLVARIFQVQEEVARSYAVVVLGGDHRYEFVARLIQEGRADCIWFVERRPGYLESTGVLPSSVDTAQLLLTQASVSDDVFEVIGSDVDSPGDWARVLQATLRERPEADVLVVCDALSGRHVRFVVDDVLEAELATRVYIHGLPYDDFELQDWWRSRTGLKQVFSHACTLGFFWIMGTKPRPVDPVFDPNAFEQELNSQFGEAACHAL